MSHSCVPVIRSVGKANSVYEASHRHLFRTGLVDDLLSRSALIGTAHDVTLLYAIFQRGTLGRPVCVTRALGRIACLSAFAYPERIIAFNPGVEERVRPYSQLEDYTAGEQNSFTHLPYSRFLKGEQWQKLRRLVVRFGPCYATEFEVLVSRDGIEWQKIASLTDQQGGTAEIEFTPLETRLVRIRAIKPDGPGQPGKQMSIAELEAYE